MKLNRCARVLILTGLLSASFGQESPSIWTLPPQAPPPASPPVVVSARQSSGGDVKAASTLYSIGDPTPEEQLYLEYINRARANPATEGVRLSQSNDPLVLSSYSFFNVNLPLMVTQFSTNAPGQPLAFNEALTDAARGHSQDMFDNVFQGHNGTDGSTIGTRAQAVGYFGSLAENVYSYAKTVFHGHAGFEVDWGNTPGSIGGMQNPPGHRINIHNPLYREVGIGVILGSNTSATDEVGPQIVTQDFGAQQNAKPLITGVAYYDLNTNSFYDVGEGIGGIAVQINGQTTAAVTARSGGYAIPVAGNGTYTVTFSTPGLADKTSTVIVAGGTNQKLDFVPTYVAPVVSGPASPSTNANNNYTFSIVGGASAYQWRQFQKTPALLEGAENGTARVTITSTAGYNVFATDIKKTGTSSFHLAHPNPNNVVTPQIIALNPIYLANANSSISFQSRLGYSASDEKARVQISADDGISWVNIYDQPGYNGAGETTFSLQTRSLAEYAGKTIRIQFVYDFTSGSYYPQTSAGVGWYIDDISFSNTGQILNPIITDTTTTSFQFKPQAIASYGLQVRAKTGHEFLEWGPITYVQSTATAPLQIGFSGISKRADGSFDLDFSILAGAAPTSFALQAKTKVTDAWADQGATVQNVSAGKYRINVPAATSGVNTRFFRVSGN